MLGLATTTGSIYRSLVTNAWGDDVDDNTTPLFTGIPMSLIEQTRSSRRKSSDRAGSVGSYTARMPNGTDVRIGDRLVDERTGWNFTVLDAEIVSSPVYTADVKIHLERAQSSVDTSMGNSKLATNIPFRVGT